MPEITERDGLLVVTTPHPLCVMGSNLEIVTVEVAPEIHVYGASHVVTSFIGRVSGQIIVHGKVPKIWEIRRCGARYHHGGRYEDITGENSALFFCDFYRLPVKNGACNLLKRVDENFRDYYSGEYDYSPGRTVVAADWVPIDRIACGNALHLCATIAQSKQWNEGGNLLRCRVALRDLCVFPYNICQIRCRKVRVIEKITE